MLFVLLALFLCCVAVPFVPAVRELRRATDDDALAISSRYREDLRTGSGDGPPILHIGPGRVLSGSVSAEHHLRVDPGCTFERLHASTIRFGAETGGGRPEPSAEALAPFRVPPGARGEAGCLFISGDLEVPARTVVPGDLIVSGQTRLGAGSVMQGSLKSRGRLVLERGATVCGGVFSEGNIEIGEGSRVHGAAAAEGRLVLATGSAVGVIGAASTATGRRVQVEAGARVHGTVWAIEAGHVRAAT